MRIHLAIVACAAVASSSPCLAVESLSQLVEQADTLASKGAGLHYDNVVGQFAASTFGPAMKSCLESIPHPDGVHLDILVVLSESGTPERFLIQPQTNLGQCVSPTIRAASFPHPPQAHYPVHLSWGFK